MRVINLVGYGIRKKPITIDNIINNFENDPIADKKDEYNQIKLDKEIKKVISYRDKINNKPINTSVLLRHEKNKK
jgi:hypothetical protein